MAKYAFLPRLGIFVGILLGLWVPIALPVYLIFREASSGFLGILLYVLFIGLIWIWGRKVEGKVQPYNYYLTWTTSRFVSNKILSS